MHASRPEPTGQGPSIAPSAAWLASLLINPDQQLRRWSSDEAAARERAAWVLKGIRRLPRERREAELDALVSWRPPIGRQVPR